jgi:hypothetical protein
MVPTLKKDNANALPHIQRRSPDQKRRRIAWAKPLIGKVRNQQYWLKGSHAMQANQRTEEVKKWSRKM